MWNVVGHDAVSIDGAWIINDTQINAVTVPASPLVGALRIGSAADRNAAAVRVSFESFIASAVGLMALWVAFGVGSAWIIQ